MIGNKTISDREGDRVIDLYTEVKVWRRLLKAMENHTDQDVGFLGCTKAPDGVRAHDSAGAPISTLVGFSPALLHGWNIPAEHSEDVVNSGMRLAGFF